MLTFCSLAAACLAASRFPPANTTLPAFCLGAAAAAPAAAPLLDGGRPGAAAPPVARDPDAAAAKESHITTVSWEHLTLPCST